MAKVKIIYKNKVPSNKAQYPINKGDSNNPTIPTLILDKLTIVVKVEKPHLRDAIENAVVSSLLDQAWFKAGKSKNGYKYSGKLEILGEETALFEAVPTIGNRPFVRLEFNPSKVGRKGIEDLHSMLNGAVPNGFDFFQRFGSVSRLDLAADMIVSNSRKSMDELIALPFEGPFTRMIGKAGRVQSLYLGLPKGNQWRIYRKDLKQRQGR